MGLCHRNEAVFIYPGVESRGGRRGKCGAYRVDELDTCEVHIILRILIDQLAIVD